MYYSLLRRFIKQINLEVVLCKQGPFMFCMWNNDSKNNASSAIISIDRDYCFALHFYSNNSFDRAYTKFGQRNKSYNLKSRIHTQDNTRKSKSRQRPE